MLMELEIITIMMQKLDLILRHNFLYMLIHPILFGYLLVLNNRVCIQWGYFSGGNGNTTKTIKFPTSFNSSCRGIAFAPYDTHTTWYPTYGTTFMIQSISKTQFYL